MNSSVLIADDDIAICEALERSLRFEGFKVRTALNGELAIEEIEKDIPIDLLVYTKSEFEKFVELGSLFSRKILSEGRELS